jgi:hypothetical protein
MVRKDQNMRNLLVILLKIQWVSQNISNTF